VEHIEIGLPRGAIAILDGLDAAFHEPDGEMASLLNRLRERIADLLPGPVLLVLGDRPWIASWPTRPIWRTGTRPGLSSRASWPPANRGQRERCSRAVERVDRARIALLNGQLRDELCGTGLGAGADGTRQSVSRLGIRRSGESGSTSRAQRARSMTAAEAVLRESLELFESSPGTILRQARSGTS